MSTLPTPRTDAMCECYCGPLCWIGDQQFIPASFAQELERELTEAKAERDALKAVNLERDAMLENQWIAIKSAHVMLSVGCKDGLGRLGTEAKHAMAALAKSLYRPTAEEFRHEQAEAVRKACANIRANEEMHKAYAHQMQEERSAIAEHCKSLEADLSRWRALAEELAEALEDLLPLCNQAMKDAGCYRALDRAINLQPGNAALARYRDAANPASARTPPRTNGRSGDEC